MKLNAKTLAILTASALACGQVAAKPPELTARGDAMDAREAAPASSPTDARSMQLPLDIWSLEGPAVGGPDPRVTAEEPRADVGAGTFWTKLPDRSVR